MFYLYNYLVGFDIYILSRYILLARRLLDIPIQALVDVLFIMLTKMPTIVWHFNIYKHDKFHAQLSCMFLFPQLR